MSLCHWFFILPCFVFPATALFVYVIFETTIEVLDITDSRSERHNTIIAMLLVEKKDLNYHFRKGYVLSIYPHPKKQIWYNYLENHPSSYICCSSSWLEKYIHPHLPQRDSPNAIVDREDEEVGVNSIIVATDNLMLNMVSLSRQIPLSPPRAVSKKTPYKNY